MPQAPRIESRQVSPVTRRMAYDLAEDEADRNQTEPRHWAHYVAEVERHRSIGEIYIKGFGFVLDE